MSETAHEPDVTIDSRGATCPGPLMDLIGKVKEAESGDVLELLTSDSGSKNDVPDWVDETDHDYLGIEAEEEHWRLYVQVA